MAVTISQWGVTAMRENMRKVSLSEDAPKTHFKLYKSGKVWLVAGLTALSVSALSVMSEPDASADVVSSTVVDGGNTTAGTTDSTNGADNTAVGDTTIQAQGNAADNAAAVADVTTAAAGNINGVQPLDIAVATADATTETKVVSRTIQYVYADGTSTGQPDVTQQVTFTHDTSSPYSNWSHTVDTPDQVTDTTTSFAAPDLSAAADAAISDAVVYDMYLTGDVNYKLQLSSPTAALDADAKTKLDQYLANISGDDLTKVQGLLAAADTAMAAYATNQGWYSGVTKWTMPGSFVAANYADFRNFYLWGLISNYNDMVMLDGIDVNSNLKEIPDVNQVLAGTYVPKGATGDISFNAVNSPVIAGYTASTPVVESQTGIGPDSINSVIKVVYTGDSQRVNVTFSDVTDSKSLGDVEVMGTSGELIDWTAVKAKLAELLAAGYEVALDPTTGVTNFDTDDYKDQLYRIRLVHSITPVTKDVTYTFTVSYQGAAENPAPVAVSATIRRTSQVDAVTKAVVGTPEYSLIAGDGTVDATTGAYQFKAVVSPTLAGYTVDLTDAEADSVDEDNPVTSKMVTYTAVPSEPAVVAPSDPEVPADEPSVDEPVAGASVSSDELVTKADQNVPGKLTTANPAGEMLPNTAVKSQTTPLVMLAGLAGLGLFFLGKKRRQN